MKQRQRHRAKLKTNKQGQHKGFKCHRSGKKQILNHELFINNLPPYLHRITFPTNRPCSTPPCDQTICTDTTDRAMSNEQSRLRAALEQLPLGLRQTSQSETMYYQQCGFAI